MEMDIGGITQRIAGSLDADRNGTIDAKEIRAFLEALTESLTAALDETPGENAGPARVSDPRPSVLASLSGSDRPGHDLKVLLNDTLADVARELGLGLASIPGASYPAVQELLPAAGGGLTAEQAALRRQITELVAERLRSDPALPDGLEVRVENPNAVSGADRIALGLKGGEPLVFDVITGAGILKARIAKNYLAEQKAVSADRIHGAQLALLGDIANRLALSAEAYQRLLP